MGIIERKEEQINSITTGITKDKILEKFATVFQGVGLMPQKHHITINKDVKPVVNPPRLVPLSLHDKLKTTFEETGT